MHHQTEICVAYFGYHCKYFTELLFTQKSILKIPIVLIFYLLNTPILKIIPPPTHPPPPFL